MIYVDERLSTERGNFESYAEWIRKLDMALIAFVRRGASPSRVDEFHGIQKLVPNVQANRPIAVGWRLG